LFGYVRQIKLAVC